MYIASNQADYYDFVAKYGADRKVVYNRRFTGLYEPYRIAIGEELKDTSENKMSKLMGVLYDHKYRSINYTLAQWCLKNPSDSYKYVILGVNGFLYGVILRRNHKDRQTFCYYSLFELPEDLRKHLTKRTYILGSPLGAMKTIECLVPFIHWNTPTFLWHEKEVYNNPKLKDMGFQRFVEPHRQFQDTAWFISNELNTRNSMPLDDVEDKYRIEQHGFNKLSFRHPVK